MRMSSSKRVFAGLPSALGGCLSPGIGQIRSSHAGSLIVACGTVTRTGAVKVLESERHYECSRCGHQYVSSSQRTPSPLTLKPLHPIPLVCNLQRSEPSAPQPCRFVVKVDMEAEATIQLPQACPAKKARPCKGRSFRHLTELQRHSDFQEIRVQERSQSLAVGAMPRSMDLIVQDDLVDTCQPGGSCDWSLQHDYFSHCLHMNNVQARGCLLATNTMSRLALRRSDECKQR